MANDSGRREYERDKKVIDGWIVRARNGDNDAWEELIRNFEDYIHDVAWKKLRKYDITGDISSMEEDLAQSGWQGFAAAVRRYDPSDGASFMTYATSYIEGEISRQLSIILNRTGVVRPKSRGGSGSSGKMRSKYVPKSPDRGRFSAERRVLQILEVLRMETDECECVTQSALKDRLTMYRDIKHGNGTKIEEDNTIISTIEEMLQELDPLEHSSENDGEYRIRYKDYENDLLKKKLDGEPGKHNITKLSYVHSFTRPEMDRLIQLICFTDILSTEEKEKLIGKLVGTMSSYYRSPLWDGEHLRYTPSVLFGRFTKSDETGRDQVAENLRILGQAVANMWQVTFTFNRYTADKTLAPTREEAHILSPYHIVVYQDNFYLIAFWNESRKVYHYRVDLMTDLQILRDGKGRPVPIEVCQFAGLPVCDRNWDPEKYMAEHLLMASDEPRDVLLKIRETGYTMLHEWFGDHYEKMPTPCEKGYDIVRIRTAPRFLVPWALRYGEAVEILDEEIRGQVREELKKLVEKYKK